ncbi:MAG: 4-(cytidine 5'-diphospho)-2-C-methyl-D-erythritol kinase [Actinomycetota bacterium]
MRVEAIARAKVNLCLRVLGKRDDGYHEVRTVMQSVDLRDHLAFELADATSVRIDVPIPQPDLVRRALDLFRLRTETSIEVKVDVVKSIPLGSGLGGASADAAAALLAINHLSGDLLSLAELARLAAELGADVPFALVGGVALATGRGDVMEPLVCPLPLWWVLGMSGIVLETAAIYKTYDSIGTPEAPVCDLSAALARGAVAEVAAMLGNDLQSSAFQAAPELERLLEAMGTSGALGVTMTGSGSVIAGLCLNESHAREVGEASLLGFQRVEVVASTSLGAQLI